MNFKIGGIKDTVGTVILMALMVIGPIVVIIVGIALILGGVNTALFAGPVTIFSLLLGATECFVGIVIGLIFFSLLTEFF